MKSLFKMTESLAPCIHPVLILGESGTGKELLALAIHELSQRPGDIPLLVHHFLELICRENKIKKPALPPELFTLLQTYAFPGNIRELKAMIENALLHHQAGNVLSLSGFKNHISSRDSHYTDNYILAKNAIVHLLDFSAGFPKLQDVEDLFYEKALSMSKNNQTLAASLLGVSHATVSRWVKDNKKPPPDSVKK